MVPWYDLVRIGIHPIFPVHFVEMMFHFSSRSNQLSTHDNSVFLFICDMLYTAQLRKLLLVGSGILHVKCTHSSTSSNVLPFDSRSMSTLGNIGDLFTENKLVRRLLD